MAWLAGTAQYSAYPPPFASAQMRSPIWKSVTPVPSPTISPAISRPRIGLASFGGG
jgi:hypothetical protein